MKKIFIIGLALLITAPVGAFFGKGFTADGINLDPEMNQSRPANVTILKCGMGRTRSLKNYKNKCLTKQIRKGIARRKSAIVQRDKPRFRGSNIPPTVVVESLLDRVRRILKAKRAAKKLK